jgi:hypothetical protein
MVSGLLIPCVVHNSYQQLKQSKTLILTLFYHAKCKLYFAIALKAQASNMIYLKTYH